MQESKVLNQKGGFFPDRSIAFNLAGTERSEKSMLHKKGGV